MYIIKHESIKKKYTHTHTHNKKNTYGSKHLITVVLAFLNIYMTHDCAMEVTPPFLSLNALSMNFATWQAILSPAISKNINCSSLLS